MEYIQRKMMDKVETFQYLYEASRRADAFCGSASLVVIWYPMRGICCNHATQKTKKTPQAHTFPQILSCGFREGAAIRLIKEARSLG